MPGDVPRAHEDIGVDELAAGLGLAGGGSDAAGDQQQQALLSDGYFSRSDEAGRSGRQNACRGRGFSSQVPHVPDRWVSDPSLAQGSSPFAADRQLNRNLSSTSSSSPSSSSSSAFLPLNPNQHHHHQHHHHHRRDLHEDHHKYNNTHDFYARPQPQPQPHTYNQPHFTPRYPARRPPPPAATPLLFPPPAPRPRRSPSAYSERSSLFSEAPPAYTPSPTTAATAFPHNYQTLSPASPLSSSSSSPPNMGRSSESEARGLLVGQTYHEIPQSMGGDPDQPDEDEFTYPRPTLRERIRRFSFRRQWKMVLLVVLLFLVTIGFLATSILGIKDQRRITIPDESSPVVTRPAIPQKDTDGIRLAYPPYDNAMAWDQNRVCGDKMVAYSPQTFDLVFDASRNISLFQDVKDTTERPANGKAVKVSGEVVLRRAASGTPGPSIVLDTLTNDESIQVGLNWDDALQQLYILSPLMTPWTVSGISPCLQLRATIWIPADSVVDGLNVDGVHLGVKLLDNLSLKLNNFARFASTVGTVVAATDGEKDMRTLMLQPPPSSFNLDTRYVEVKTLSSAIGGSWPLADYLGLETISGSIRTGVRPKPALEDKPRPAILYARSTSGPIEVHEPVNEAVAMFAATQSSASAMLPPGEAMVSSNDPAASSSSSNSVTLSAESVVPPRQYGVDLYSMSGSVSGNIVFGYSAKVHTTSGHVTLTMLPVLDEAQANAPERGSMIETATTSGTTEIRVLDALWRDVVAGVYVPAPVLTSSNTTAAAVARDLDARQPQQQGGAETTTTNEAPPPNPALRVLSARHSGTSANLFLTYPRSWEGYIDCDSMSGKIDVGGKDVQIIKRENGLPGIKQHVLAGKGDWQTLGAQVKVHTTSGKIGVMVAT